MEHNIAQVNNSSFPLHDLSKVGMSNVEIFNAVTNSQKLETIQNIPVNIIGYKFGTVSINNDETGETMVNQPIVYLFTNRDIYHSVSRTLMNRLQDLFELLGVPSTWKEKFEITFVKKSSSKNNQFWDLTIKVVKK